MAKAAFRVDDGIIPGHVNVDLGHSSAQFRNTYISAQLNVGGNADVDGNLNVDGGLIVDGPVTIPQYSGGGGGGGGGVTTAQSIAFAIALG